MLGHKSHNSQAAWQYPLHLASRLHEKSDEDPTHSTVDIVVHKFKHLRRAIETDEFMATDDPDAVTSKTVLIKLT